MVGRREVGRVDGGEDKSLASLLSLLHLVSEPGVEFFFRGDGSESGHLGDGGGLECGVVVSLGEPSPAETETAVVVGDGVVVVDTLLDGGRVVDSAPLLEFVVVGGVIQVEDSGFGRDGLVMEKYLP